ncbi:MAG: hypothetical protein IKB01_11760 [Lachnospiraceae bacterium]|nr:hypothetical protein [Lachnospiraceae bacterium]MBR3761328.1 hypothetical protein [Lachnospiraceae bacterium]
MSGEIIFSDALEKLNEELRILKAKLAELLQEKDDLIYHVCPELRAKYAAEIGDYQNRANYQELMILELKRRIEIARAALNREQSISEEEVDKQIEKEYQEFHQKVDEEYQKSKKSQEEQAQKEEKRKFYEEQWKNQYGKRKEDENTEKNSDTKDSDGENSDTENTSRKSSGDDPEDIDTKPKEKPLPNAKDLYRKIVKKLHPDMNPDVTEHELELFHRAAKAYEEGDIMTLQAIYDEVYGLDTKMLSQEESMETLISLREQLLERIAKTIEEIEAIKEEFPYTEKAFLDNPEAVKEMQDAIIRLIQEYEKEIIRLNQILQEVNHEMEELQKKKRDRIYE